MKKCVNTLCGNTTPREWKKGWPLPSGGYAQLCYNCGSAYENSVYCDAFHANQSGWRECSICNKRLHCGCIASKHLFELLEFEGVGCNNCTKSSHPQSIQTGEISNGFRSFLNNDVGNLDSTLHENDFPGGTTNEEKFAQLRRLMEVHESNLMSKFDGAETDAGLGLLRKEEVRQPIGEAIVGFSKATQSPSGTSKFVKLDGIRPVLETRDMNGPHAQPLGNSSFVPYSCWAVEERELGQTFPIQQGQRSSVVVPKISKPRRKHPRKHQLFPRYWPRITDQELQKLSGDLNSKIVPLFEKVLSASDAGRIGRLVLPKACAEAYFPPISESDGFPLTVQDVKGREWTFQFRFWPNNNSRMYVLEGVTPCIESLQLQAGDTITFSRIDPGGKLVVGFRKAANNFTETPIAPTNGATVAEASDYAEGGNVCNKSDAMQQPMAKKKRARNIGPKSKRLLMHSDDASELQITWEEVQGLLHPRPSVKAKVVTIEDHDFEEYDEPPVFGKRTLSTDELSGTTDSGDLEVQSTTKHPRHKPGCSCIVCIQPPSGKAKHEPTCTCNVCMAVKRRFETLKLNKNKRRSQEFEIVNQNGKQDQSVDLNIGGPNGDNIHFVCTNGVHISDEAFLESIGWNLNNGGRF